jgi:hypothetical protein
MGFFDRIYIRDKKTGVNIDITTLDKDRYESFLDAMGKLQIAYDMAIDTVQGDITPDKPLVFKITQDHDYVEVPDESQIEESIDKLLIQRGEHPTRVRNPYYGEERQLAKDLLKKYVTLK